MHLNVKMIFWTKLVSFLFHIIFVFLLYIISVGLIFCRNLLFSTLLDIILHQRTTFQRESNCLGQMHRYRGELGNRQNSSKATVQSRFQVDWHENCMITYPFVILLFLWCLWFSTLSSKDTKGEVLYLGGM